MFGLRKFIFYCISMTCVFGCEQPYDRMPPGYVDACAGGRDSAKKNWVCGETRLAILMNGAETDWPELRDFIAGFGHDRYFEFFDTSTAIPDYIRTLEVSVCSSEGMHLSIDHRIYSESKLNRTDNRIIIELRTYNGSFEWEPVANELVEEFRAIWQKPAEIHWPEPLGSERALPDSIDSCDEATDVST